MGRMKTSSAPSPTKREIHSGKKGHLRRNLPAPCGPSAGAPPRRDPGRRREPLALTTRCPKKLTWPFGPHENTTRPAVNLEENLERSSASQSENTDTSNPEKAKKKSLSASSPDSHQPPPTPPPGEFRRRNGSDRADSAGDGPERAGRGGPRQVGHGPEAHGRPVPAVPELQRHGPGRVHVLPVVGRRRRVPDLRRVRPDGVQQLRRDGHGPALAGPALGEASSSSSSVLSGPGAWAASV
ncbi:hypothetical protein NL676_032609 [Syzygium grande]|nr:hypothetical protein NL676_032609 [Syzygium grande]